MSGVGEAYCLLTVIVDRIGPHKFPGQVFVGKDYSLGELLDDLREAMRLLSATKTETAIGNPTKSIGNT